MEHRRGRSDGRLGRLLRRVAPHWPLVLTLAIAAAAVLWWASYGVAQ